MPLDDEVEGRQRHHAGHGAPTHLVSGAYVIPHPNDVGVAARVAPDKVVDNVRVVA